LRFHGLFARADLPTVPIRVSIAYFSPNGAAWIDADQARRDRWQDVVDPRCKI